MKKSNKIIIHSKEICEKLLRDLELAKRPVLEATKCSLDNSIYDANFGYLTPAGKKGKK